MVFMSYITIRKISKFQYWWAEVEKLSSDEVEKITWIDESNAKFLTKSYGIDPTSIASLLKKGEKLDEIIRVPSTILANNLN